MAVYKYGITTGDLRGRENVPDKTCGLVEILLAMNWVAKIWELIDRGFIFISSSIPNTYFYHRTVYKRKYRDR